MNTRTVKILNGETKTQHEFEVYLDLLPQLKELTDTVTPAPVWGEGVDSTAVMGMSLLFASIPHKFPVQYILLWLRDEIDPNLSLPVVEAALIQLARQHVW